MFDKGHVFSDVYAHKLNLVTGIDARTKIIFVIAVLLINLLSSTIYSPFAIAVFCLVTLLLIGIPPKLLGMRLAMPLITASIVVITQVFFYGGTPLFTIHWYAIHLVGYQEGLAHGLLIMCRVVGGVSAILFLGMSTPANKLLMAAAWFRMPGILIELALIMYRYIFVLLEEALTIRDAQKVRLGYHNWLHGMRSLGILGGSVILRAYDRAESVFEAMTARGYTGAMSIKYVEHYSRRDYVAAACMVIILVMLYLAGRLGA